MTQNTINKSPSFQQLYKCNICGINPNHPVLSKCGHLFCWSCLFKQLQKQTQCIVCKSNCQRSECYPIFIEQDSQQMINEQISKRPQPQHHDKIINPSIGTGSVPFGITNLPNNISRKKILMGPSLPPSMFIQAFNVIENASVQDSDKGINQKCKIFSITLLIFVIILILFILIK